MSGEPITCTRHANALKHFERDSAAFAAHELEKVLDEDMTEEEARELEEAEAIGRKFLEWNLDDEAAMRQPLKEFVAEILGMANED